MTRIQSQQAQAAATMNGQKNGSKLVTTPAVDEIAVGLADLAAEKADAKRAAAKLATATSNAKPKATPAEKWSTVTVTAATPPFSPNRAHPVDVAYDSAKLHGHAILKVAGKPDREYVRCLDGVVRGATNPLAQAALKANAPAK